MVLRQCRHQSIPRDFRRDRRSRDRQNFGITPDHGLAGAGQFGHLVAVDQRARRRDGRGRPRPRPRARRGGGGRPLRRRLLKLLLQPGALSGCLTVIIVTMTGFLFFPRRSSKI